MDDSPFAIDSGERVASPLSIGLLVESATVSHYVHDFVVWAQSHPKLAVSHLIILEAQGKPKPNEKSSFASIDRGSARALSTLAFRAIERFERALIAKDVHHSVHLRRYDLRPLIQNVVKLPATKADVGYWLDPLPAKMMKKLDLDLILHCGQMAPMGDICEASRLGVIAVHCGDPQRVRGGPPGYWEVHHRHETTGFAILRLRENHLVGDTLMRGHVATRHYYLLNQALVSRKAYHHLKRLVEKIAVTGKLPDRLTSFPYPQRLCDMPRLLDLLAYAGRRFGSIVVKRLRRLLGIEYRSTVAYVCDRWTDAVLVNGVKLPNRPMHYLADPFVIWRGERAYCFVEDLDYATQRGSIDVYELTNDGGERIGTALQEDFHLSFPYLFEHGGELYMCPESSENRDIRIYKCVAFPLQWKLATIAMQDISAVDSIIFERDGKWWMLTNIDPVGIGDHCAELYVFFADSPLENGWKPHALNPVLIDAARARNAGHLADGGRFYRCAQGQGFDFYGKRVLINEILELTETRYRECLSSIITPSFGTGVAGTHHLHSDGRTTVFDFVTSSRIVI
jgi:hypothetical protein